ncbi:MAG: HAMP domain-containing histidine kinase [Lachnospiraceae bacterium]|nr:HAMP domain-containing histidine kinase [Lachnospiraceae bacterium]
MKNYKSKDRSLYILLIKNYIIYTLVMVFLMMSIYFFELLVEKSIIQSPRVDKPLGGQELLKAGEYEKLDLKTLLGATGYFVVLDENGQLVYTDNPDRNESYTKREIECIPEYNSPYIYTATVYCDEDDREQTLVTQRSFEWDTGYKENIAYMVLDENLKVIQSNLSGEIQQFTRRELDLMTLNSDTKYSVYKYEFEESSGSRRTLLMHVKKMDRQRYKKLDSLWKIFIPVYILSYVLILLVFTIWMRRKVKEPLDMLNEGILAFADGNRDTEINYKGPKEFEAIFDSFNKMSRLLKESESSKEHLIVEKQRMLADISHDLKTPITVIRGYAKAVSDGLTDPETEKQYLNTIFLKTESLTEMINTFYDYSKLEHPEFRLIKEKQDLAEFIREYLANKYDEIDLMGFELEVEIPETEVEYCFDSVQMRRVFDNIFSNALKHNPTGTTVYITLQQTEKSIRIEIADNGTGIPEEIRSNLFEPFTVGDDSRNNRQGSGLGLAVARKIVELHGGALLLEKPVNPGISTLFVIRLMK